MTALAGIVLNPRPATLVEKAIDAIDVDKRTVRFSDGGELRLTKSEIVLFEALMKARPKVVKTDHLYQALYWTAKDCEMPEPAILKVFISKLRRKLGPFGLEIQTIWGNGYFIPPAEGAAP